MSEQELLNQEATELQALEAHRNRLLTNLYFKQDILIKANTHWEQLTCVGYNPQLGRLEAVVSVKQASGYSTGLCKGGSTEYVRFFVDWGDGASFKDVGVTSCKAFNIPGVSPRKTLKYMVYTTLDDAAHRRCCEFPVLPKARAVLSWNQVPSLDPHQLPAFGNILDASIQLRPNFSIQCLIESGMIKQEAAEILEKSGLISKTAVFKPLPAQPEVLIRDYRQQEVPDHRTAYTTVFPLLKGGDLLAKAAPGFSAELLKIDVDKVVEVLSDYETSDMTFEQLVCAGLHTSSDLLGAVVHVKKPSGYSGGLCNTGSKEYVAFWADWNGDGAYEEYLGTASVDVHDIGGSLPAGGLYYGVVLPCNFASHVRSCTKPNLVRIRAVLSWSIPPSTIDPEGLNYWGNRLDVEVQIRTGEATSGMWELIYDVGNVDVTSISQSGADLGLAFPSHGVLHPYDASQPALDRPFGGWIRIGGRIYDTGAPGSVHFQVQYRPHGSTDWLPATHDMTFDLMHPDPSDPHFPEQIITISSPDGWFPYLEDPVAMPPIMERTSALAWWNAGALSGLYDLRLAYTKDYPIAAGSVIYYSGVATIMVNNVNYVPSPTPNVALDMASTLDLIIDGGDCRQYAQGITITGRLRAVHSYFWKWVFDLQPTTHTHGIEPDPPFRCYGSLSDAGNADEEWSLATKSADPANPVELDICGYTLTLWAYDRTIVDSNGAIVHYNRKAVGFCIVEPSA
ncbi:MAG: hypothetical protein ABSC17_03925 [Thermacetogeniaceae bacterium]